MNTAPTRPHHLILTTPHTDSTTTVTAGPVSDQSPTGQALNELERLVADLRTAHHIDDHLRALSSLVAIQPLVGLLTSLKQQHLEHHSAEPSASDRTNDGGYV